MSHALQSREVDQLLHKMNKHIEIRRYAKRNGWNDGIYYRRKYICAIPQAHMFKFENPDYLGGMTKEVPHLSIDKLAKTLINNDIIRPHDYKVMMNY